MYLLWTPLSTHAYAHMHLFTLWPHSHSPILPPTIVSFNLLWTLSLMASPTQQCHPYHHSLPISQSSPSLPCTWTVSHSISQHCTTHPPFSFFNGCTLSSLHILFSIGHHVTPLLWACHSLPQWPQYCSILHAPTLHFPLATSEDSLLHKSLSLSHPLSYHHSSMKLLYLTRGVTLSCITWHQLPLLQCSVCCTLPTSPFINYGTIQFSTQIQFLHTSVTVSHVPPFLYHSLLHLMLWCSVTGHLSSIPLHNDHVLWPSIELPFTLVSLLEHLVPSPKWHVHPHSLSAPSLLPHHLVFPEPAIHFFISINFPFPLPPYNESLLLDYLFYAVFPTIVTQTSSCHLIIQFSTHLSHIPHPVLVWLSSPHTPIYHCLSFP